MCVLGVEGFEKNVASPRIISGTALRCRTIGVQVFLIKGTGKASLREKVTS